MENGDSSSSEKVAYELCRHDHLEFEMCDQAPGVSCIDCNYTLAYCWGDEHIPETLWNRLCEQDPDARPCKKNRDDVCAICEWYMGRNALKRFWNWMKWRWREWADR